MKCDACAAANDPGAGRCHACAAPLSTSCAHCGAALGEDAWPPLRADLAGLDADDGLCAPCRARDLETALDHAWDEAIAGDVAEDETVVSAAPYDLRPRFTGRADALERLTRVVDTTVERRTLGFVLLVAEPGLGKTRTLEELGRLTTERHPGTRVLIAAAHPRGQPYDVFARLLTARFGVQPVEPAEVSQQKILAAVTEVMPAARVAETAHLLGHIMRLPFQGSAVLGPLMASPQKLQARAFLALRRFLALDAARTPILCGVENLELCEPESINLLHYLVAGLAHAPLTIIGTARAALFERHPSFGATDEPLEQMELGPLSAREAEALMRELGRDLHPIPTRLVEHGTRIGGSPRALHELMRLLFETGVIGPGRASSGGAAPVRWTVDDARLAAARLPETHAGLVEARLDVMAAGERRILEMASVAGETFWLDTVLALYRVCGGGCADPDGPTLATIATTGDHSRAEVVEALASLVEGEWIAEVLPPTTPGEREFRFAYPHQWETVYRRIDDARRRRYHTVVAQTLELQPEERAALLQEDIGDHLEHAGDLGGAAAKYRGAGDAARKGFLNDRSIRLYQQALACLGEADLAARICLWHDLGSVYELKGEYDAALGAFERMLRLAWICASRTKAAVAFNKTGRVWRRKGDLKLALEYLEHGRELFEQADDARGIAASLDDIGSVFYLLGRYDEAFTSVSEGLARRGKTGDRRSIAHSLSSLGNIQRNRGRLAEAEACHREALELHRATDDRVGVITALDNLATLALEHGDRAEARRGWEQALREGEEIGALPLQAQALGKLGELALGEDRQEEARRRLGESLEISREIADPRLEVEATRTLALLEYRSANLSRARELADRAYQCAAAAGLREIEGRALLTLGEVFGGAVYDAEAAVERSTPDAPTQAESFFARGVAILRHIGNPSELARGLEGYGRYKIEHGEAPAGKHLLREASQLFTHLGLARARDVERMLAHA